MGVKRNHLCVISFSKYFTVRIRCKAGPFIFLKIGGFVDHYGFCYKYNNCYI